MESNIVKGENKFSNKKPEKMFSLSAKELDWLLRKLSEIRITMVEIDTASGIWNKLSTKHKEIVNAQHDIKMENIR